MPSIYDDAAQSMLDSAQRAASNETSAAQTQPIGPQPVAQPVNPYEAAADSMVSNNVTRIRRNVYGASGSNPDNAARAHKIAQRTGAYPDAVERNLPQAQRDILAQDVDEGTMDSPTLRDSFFDPYFTKVAQDDMPALKSVERAVRQLIDPKSDDQNQSRQAISAVGSYLAEGAKQVGMGLTVGLGAGIQDMAGFTLDIGAGLTGSAYLQDAATMYRNYAVRARESMDYFSKRYEGNVSQGIMSGFRSAGTNLALLPAGMAYGANAMLIPMVGMVGAQSYNKARDKGQNRIDAAIYAAPDAVFEYAFEKIPASRLLADITKHSNLLTMVRNQLVPEVLGEQATTILQDLNEWVRLNPSKTVQEFIAERPGAAVQTLMATLVGVGVQSGTIRGVARVMNNAAEREARVADATVKANQLDQIFQIASGSNLRGRDAETFAGFVQKIADDGEALSQVHVDADQLIKVLDGAKIDMETFAQMSPDAARDLPDAISSGGSVAIPVGDLIGKLGDAGLDAALLPHLRVGENALSLEEAQQEQAAAQQFLQQAGIQVVEQAQQSAIVEESAARVRENLTGQLQATGRFSADVNSAYASLAGSFYTTLAEQLGVTPEQAYAAYPLRVQGAGQGDLTQPRDTAPGSSDMDASVAALQGIIRPDIATAINNALRGFKKAPPAAPLSAPELETATKILTPMFKSAKAAKPVFDNTVTSIANAIGAQVKIPGIKKIERSSEKLIRETDDGNGNPNPEQMRDLLRATVIVPRVEDVNKAIAAVHDKFQVVRVKNRFETPTEAGYRDVLINVRLPDGLQAEIQVNVPAMMLAKKAGHKLYSLMRGMTDAATIQPMYELQKELYGDAFQNAMSSASALDAMSRNTSAGNSRDGLTANTSLPSASLSTGTPSTSNSSAPSGIENLGISNPPSFQSVAQDTSKFDPALFDATDPDILHQSAYSAPDGPLVGLPDVVRVDGVATRFGPFQPARDAAAQYMASVGREYDAPRYYVKVDPERATRIAQAFEDMAHAPNDPAVKAAYQAMIEETLQQWQAIKATGLQVEFIDGEDPYGNPRNAILDVVNNNHLWVYPTTAGFGGSALETQQVDVSGNPLMETVPYEMISGRPVQVNDIFRIVHDYFGHIKEGTGFRADGEENAWRSHWAMYSPEAQKAMTSETRGQNSWVNFGPYADFNKTASGADTQYAPQKIGLLPEWVINEGATDSQDGTIAGDTLAAKRFNQAVLAKALVDSAGAASEDFANVLVGISKVPESDRFGAVPALAPVLAHMRSVILDKPEILDAVIESVPVDVVNNFFGSQDAAKMAFHDQAMLENSLAFDAELPVTGGAETTNPVGFLVRQVAFSVAEQVSSATNAGFSTPASGAAVGANEVDALAQGKGDRASFSPKSLTITLLENADLTSFLHETGHFMLTAMADIASRPDAPARISEDMATILKWFNVPDLATWNKQSLREQRANHEKFAESFEQYLFEGKAPSRELQPMFQRFRSWMQRIYQSLQQFLAGHNTQLSDEVRAVFDRMLATDDQIARKQEELMFQQMFTNNEGGFMSDAEFADYMTANQMATGEAIDELQKRSLRDLKWVLNARSKEMTKQSVDVKAKRKAVEAEVRAEVRAEPVYAVQRWIKTGVNAEGEQQTGAKLHTEDLKAIFGEGPAAPWRYIATNMLTTSREDSLPPDTIASMFGFASGEQMVRDIVAAFPEDSTVQGITDNRMMERYGDISSPRAMEDAANAAVHNEFRAKAMATELKAMTQATQPARLLMAAARSFAEQLVGRKVVKQLRPRDFAAAETRAAKRVLEAQAKGDLQGAAVAKRDQVLQFYSAKEAARAIDDIKKAREFFQDIVTKKDDVIGKSRDMALVNTARAILANYGFGAKAKSAHDYLLTVREHDPQTFDTISDRVMAAELGGKPFDQLTVDEVRALADEVKSLWRLSKRTKQIEIDGKLMALDDAQQQLVDRLTDLGIPSRIAGEGHAVTPGEQRLTMMQTFVASLRRVESWIERKDGADTGPFRRLLYNTIKDAADSYRQDRNRYIKSYKKLLESVAGSMVQGKIDARELGYVFGFDTGGIGMAELLHAMLHTGNESNKRKLLLGRKWATENDDGTLDTSRWDGFVQRMIDEGRLTKAHFDFMQGVWDLLESTKPQAQKMHRDVFGKYFKEVENASFVTPFGSYRGGYVPAMTDPRVVADARTRQLMQEQNESMANAFPATNRGFTKSRVDYNQPLMLDLRTLSQHLDKVLLFSHLEGPVRDARRLMTGKSVAAALNRVDPTAFDSILTPWLNRTARQQVETPITGDARLMRVFTVVRRNAGMAAMFANVMNAAQQVTGFSIAATKVPVSSLTNALAQYIAHPVETTRTVADASKFMADRMDNEVSAMHDAIEDILIDPNVYQKAQSWTRRHAYFMQAAVDNVMSPIIWLGAYNDALARGMNTEDARRHGDSVIRTTQGSTLPEDVSRIETGNAFVRMFTQFAGYFNMMANTNASELLKISDGIGLKRGAGKALYVLMMGALAPAWIAEAIAQAFKGGPDDDDDDGWYIDDWAKAVFGFGTLRTAMAAIPGFGQLVNAGVNVWNKKPYDDRLGSAPAVNMLESSVRAPVSVYNAIVEDGNKQKAVRDLATAISIVTGLPATALARPVGYLAGVADDKIDPTGPVDAARGVVTGTASPKSK